MIQRLAALQRGAALAALALLAALSGCNVSKPAPDQNLFVIETGHPAAATTAPATAPALTLRILPVRIARPFDSQTFQYKVGPDQYRIDYYNGFVAPPSRLLGGQLAAWLHDSGTVKYAVTTGSSLDCKYSLESNVTSLYGDYTKPAAPKAVIEMDVFLVAEEPAGTRLIMQKAYHRDEPAGDGKPAALAAAFGRAYRAVLTQLSADLRSVH